MKIKFTKILRVIALVRLNNASLESKEIGCILRLEVEYPHLEQIEEKNYPKSVVIPSDESERIEWWTHFPRQDTLDGILTIRRPAVSCKLPSGVRIESVQYGQYPSSR